MLRKLFFVSWTLRPSPLHRHILLKPLINKLLILCWNKNYFYLYFITYTYLVETCLKWKFFSLCIRYAMFVTFARCAICYKLINPRFAFHVMFWLCYEKFSRQDDRNPMNSFGDETRGQTERKTETSAFIIHHKYRRYLSTFALKSLDPRIHVAHNENNGDSLCSHTASLRLVHSSVAGINEMSVSNQL